MREASISIPLSVGGGVKRQWKRPNRYIGSMSKMVFQANKKSSTHRRSRPRQLRQSSLSENTTQAGHFDASNKLQGISNSRNSISDSNINWRNWMILNSKPAEVAKEVWEIGNKMVVVREGEEINVIEQLEKMEDRDRRAIRRESHSGN